MNEDFKKRADGALSLLSRELAGAADDYGYRSSFSGGSIQIDCRSAKVTVSANPAAEQVIVQAPGKSYKLDWDIVEATFVHSESGQNLREVIEQTLSKCLRQEVSL